MIEYDIEFPRKARTKSARWKHLKFKRNAIYNVASVSINPSAAITLSMRDAFTRKSASRNSFQEDPAILLSYLFAEANGPQ